ncbi:MAG: prepilin-type N-terminal cleavage/methylation domain-containing protein [Bdellovibrionales bacterium]|nr:prepilin-type N-terminal cleavage/methylation domain-containing protein [Oligoflexia bacterium]
MKINALIQKHLAPTRKITEAGFTLLEVMIAVGILAIGIGAILVAENNSLDVTIRAKRITTVATLAKNTLIQAERELQGKTFDETKKESSGKFDAPYAEYSWDRKIKEITFPNVMDPAASGGGGEKKEDAAPVDQNVERVVKIATNYLSKSSRELTVTINWTEKGEKQSFSVSQYWVDLNHEFNFTEQ